MIEYLLVPMIGLSGLGVWYMLYKVIMLAHKKGIYP